MQQRPPTLNLERWILLATSLASGASFLMGTAVSIALPSIQTYFGSSISGLQWVANAQLLALSALVILGGSLGDHFGRKRIFMIGASLFTASAIFSGLAPTINLLITFQGIQGIGAALMVPQSLAIINAVFPENRRGRAIGLWAGISGALAALGPWLGGVVIQSFSWRGVFFMIVPVSAVVLVVAALFIADTREQQKRRLDWLGTLFIFLGLLGLAYGLISGPVSGWTQPSIIVTFAGGAVAIILFVFNESRHPEPLIPTRIFKNPLVTGANIATFFLYFGLNGIIFFLVLNLQQVQGFSPTAAGLGLLVPTVLIAFLSGPAGALADRIGPRLQMILGPTLVAAGAALLTIYGTDADYLKHFMPGLVFVGTGMALVIAPLTKSALSVEPQFSGSASGVNNGVARVAGLMAIAILGAVVVSTFTVHLQETVTSAALTPEQRELIINQSDKLGGIVIPGNFNDNARAIARAAIKESFIYGFRWAMGICAVLAAAAAAVSAATIHNRSNGPL